MTPPPDTSRTLNQLMRRYRKTGAPLPMNFRELVPWIPYNSQRFTHQLHSYPAKVIPQIPHFFLSAAALTPSNATVVDPFSGSGTVALEACLAGKDVIVSDSNPVARLITTVKTSPQCPTKLRRQIQELRSAVGQSRARTTPDVVNLDYWYTPHVVRQLTRIIACIQNLNRSNFKRLCEVALSACARKSSLADPRVSVPVRLKPHRYPAKHPLKAKSLALVKSRHDLDVLSLFFSILETLAQQVASLWPLRAQIGRIASLYENSLSATSNSLALHPENTADLVVTSPPYLGAQKYIRATSLTIGWLSLARADELRGLEDLSIGREHFRKNAYSSMASCGIADIDTLIEAVYRENPLRAHIAATYIREMRDVLATCYKVLKPGGKLVLVSGCNTLSGRLFSTTRYLQEICLELGFDMALEVTDTIKSRGLMTRRNRTAGTIPMESVTLFEK